MNKHKIFIAISAILGLVAMQLSFNDAYALKEKKEISDYLYDCVTLYIGMIPAIMTGWAGILITYDKTVDSICKIAVFWIWGLIATIAIFWALFNSV
jgi:hypothetical protein